MPHTADWALFVESELWNMRGDWPGFHSVVQAYKRCLDSSIHPALIVNMIKALYHYLRRKVISGAQADIPRRCHCTYVGSFPHCRLPGIVYAAGVKASGDAGDGPSPATSADGA